MWLLMKQPNFPWVKNHLFNSRHILAWFRFTCLPQRKKDNKLLQIFNVEIESMDYFSCLSLYTAKTSVWNNEATCKLSEYFVYMKPKIRIVLNIWWRRQNFQMENEKFNLALKCCSIVQTDNFKEIDVRPNYHKLR